MDDWERLAFIIHAADELLKRRNADDVRRWAEKLQDRCWMKDIYDNLAKETEDAGEDARNLLYRLINTVLPVVRYQLRILPDRAEPEVKLETVAGLVMYQLALEATGHRSTQQCLECGRWFVVGGKDGMRRGAKFCSDNCRGKYHNRVNPVMSNRKRKNSGGMNKKQSAARSDF